MSKRLPSKKKLPYLLNTRYKTEKGASQAMRAMVEERKSDAEIAAGDRPLTAEEWHVIRRHEEELALAKLRELRAQYEEHLKISGR